MRADELAEEFPIVGLDTNAMAAARTLGARRLPGLIVVDDEGRPYTVLPGSQVLRFMIPSYVLEDPALARVVDEEAAEQLMRKLSDASVRDLLPERPHLDQLPVVEADTTTLEVAAVMAQMHSPLVAVVDGSRVLGAITVRRLLSHLLPDPSPDS
jgi:CBS domain-containing protein